jgi:sortase (surface protein transpeptidase)
VAADDEDLATDQEAVFPPRRLRIPAIGVDAPVDAMGLLPDRTVEVPADIDLVGWYDRLAQPGDPGVTVAVGHIDGREGPGVFVELEQLGPGDRVEMDRGDRETVVYEVVEVTSYPKDDFPTRAVFDDPRDEVLQLITCGGSFDTQARSYTENIVATAVPIG